MESNEAPFIEWKDTYNIGFERFDREHQELMELTNVVVAAIRDKVPHETVNAAFMTLLDRTCWHFDNEEELMKQTFYSHLPQHRANHNELVRTLASFAAEYRKGIMQPLQAAHFLQDWLLEHVLQADVHYTQHFLERGIR